MKIYTKTGDKGDTSLAVGGRVRKSNKRLEAYGTADELNSYVGWLRAKIVAKSPIWHIVVDEQLAWVQNRLFDVGAILAGADMEVTEDAVCQLEKWIDEMQAELPVLREFILPYGDEMVSVCHVCRTVCRRAERAALRASTEHAVDSGATRYLNRLSDYLYTLGRVLTERLKVTETLWIP